MIDFKIRPDEGDAFEVKATTRDILQWERTTPKASLKKLLEELHIGDLYKVAYLASRRRSLFSGTQQEFENTVDLEFELEDDDADPTQSAA